jgi:hypothetical protein
MGWTCNFVEENGITYRIIMKKPLGKQPCARSGRWKADIKINFKKFVLKM